MNLTAAVRLTVLRQQISLTGKFRPLKSNQENEDYKELNARNKDLERKGILINRRNLKLVNAKDQDINWNRGKMAVRKDLYVWTVNSCYSWKLNINRIELKTKESHACQMKSSSRNQYKSLYKQQNNSQDEGTEIEIIGKKGLEMKSKEETEREDRRYRKWNKGIL